MDRAYFIGIVPPEGYLKRIQHFQNKWNEHTGVEPHITLKAQGGLTADREWVEKVKEVCSKSTPFQLTLEGPAYFGDIVLYLQVRSHELIELHHQLVRAVSPSNEMIKQYFEGEDFVPHLTLAKETYSGGISKGVSRSDLKEMEKKAKEELTSYPTFDVTFIRIYELNADERKYEPLLDVPLGEMMESGG